MSNTKAIDFTALEQLLSDAITPEEVAESLNKIHHKYAELLLQTAVGPADINELNGLSLLNELRSIFQNMSNHLNAKANGISK